MKKFFVYLIVTFIFAISAAAQKQMSAKEADGFKGKVKTVITEHAKLQNQAGTWIENKKVYYTVLSYDLNGNRIKREFYNDGNLFEISIYSFVDGVRAGTRRKRNIRDITRRVWQLTQCLILQLPT